MRLRTRPVWVRCLGCLLNGGAGQHRPWSERPEGRLDRKIFPRRSLARVWPGVRVVVATRPVYGVRALGGVCQTRWQQNV